MKIQTLPFIVLLVCAGQVAAQSGTVAMDASALKPLNLSARKLQTQMPDAAPDKAQPSSRKPGSDSADVLDTQAPEQLPYGAGYDSRQRGAAAGSGSGGRGAGSGGSGRGGR